jgi:hypothetical protein
MNEHKESASNLFGTVVIDRKKWRRGKIGESNYLFANDKYCCLGFLSKAAGVSDERMKFKELPIDLDFIPESIKWTIEGNRSYFLSEDCILAYRANDYEMREEEREKKIVEIFERNGWQVKFIN